MREKQGMESGEYKQEAYTYIDKNAKEYIQTADYIWDHPELSLKEFQAAGRYCEELKKLGFTVTENLCGIKTAFSEIGRASCRERV